MIAGEINSEGNKIEFIKLDETEFIEQEINCINENLDSIYLDKLNKEISEEQFNRVKVKLENELPA